MSDVNKISALDAMTWADLRGKVESSKSAYLAAEAAVGYWQLHLKEKYGLQENDTVTKDLEILREPVRTNELVEEASKAPMIIVPKNGN